MNKQAYRVIFNKNRGMSMAVAELVSSNGKSAGSASGTPSSPLLRLAHLNVAIAALFGAVTVVQAQIVADPNAGAQRPTIDQTASGLPLVQIAAPNAAGLSHNQYQQFNVDRNGAILNNARTISQTQLGGYVDGNAKLTNGSARLILNEVTGAGRSQLNGYIEVAGQRAQVIVANPNGISCSGCGFINTSRGVLTTGTPVFGGDGSLGAFRVGRGDIQVGGLNAANTDQLDLIARSVRVNRELWANNLNVVSGANQVGYADLGVQVIQGEGGQPTVGIDVAQLGGMYANKIRLVGTAAGVGVVSLGNIAAQAGDVTIDSHGKVTLNGNTSASGRIAIRSDDAVSNSGTMAAQNDLSLTASSIYSSGTLAAGSDANGQVTQAGNLNLNASGAIAATGRNTAGSHIAMTGGSLNLANATTNSVGNATLTATAGAIVHTCGNLQVAGSATLNATGAINNHRGTIHTVQLSSHSASLSNSGGTITQSGSGATTIAAGGALDNSAGTITANAQRLTLQSGSLSNDAGKINHAGAGTLTLNSGALSNFGGSIATNGQLALTAAGVNNQRGALLATGRAALNVVGNLDNTAGTVQASKALQISAANIDNSAGRLSALHTDGFSLNASGQLTNSGGNIGSAADLNIHANTIAGDGNISAGQDATIQLQGNYTNSAGNRISANRDLRVHTTGDLINAGHLASVGNLNLAANNITNQYGALIHAGGGTAVINASNALYNIGRIYGDDIAIGAHSVVNDGVLRPDGSTHQAGVIAARNTLQIGAQHITNREHALIQSLGDMTLGGALDGNHQVSGSAANILNASATIDAGGALRLQTAALMNQNKHFTTEMQLDPSKTRRVTEYRSWIDGSWYRPEQVTWDDSGDGGIVLVLPGNARFEKFYKRDYTQTVRQTVVTRSDPGKITAGGHMLLSGSVTNDKSTMIAGGTISGSAGPVNNLGASGEAVTTNRMTAAENYYHYVDGHPHQNHYEYDHNGAAYDVVLPATPLALQVWTKQENTRPITGPNQAVGNHVDTNTGIGGSHHTVGHAASPLPNLTLPNSQLFQLRPRPGQSYLIETDPAFTNYQHFISSDYLLGWLALDPQKVHKRLGDGFYEQKLINDQIAQLTGKRFLGSYTSNEEQYKALMEAGSASAKQFQLTPGIALSAAQMAALTSDIVWLVAQEVKLPDGSTSSVLVPVVYLTRASTGDIAPSGALISGKDIDLTINGSLHNGGTLQASNNLIVHAGDIANTGKLRSTGTDGSTILAAQNDVQNHGGTLAGHRVGILAGRDVTISTDTASAASVNGTNVGLGRVASVSADQLNIQSGRDIHLAAAAVNTTGDAALAAGRDLNLTAVTTQTASHVAYDSQNHLNESQTQVTGSNINTGGKLALIAARDINAAAAYANADGQLAAVAGRDVKLGTAQQDISLDQAITTTSKGMLSSSTSRSQTNAHSTTAVGSTLSGDAVIVQAGRDIDVTGSNVVGTHDVALAAGNNVTIATAQSTSDRTFSSEEKTSGMFSSGGIGFTIGSQSSKDTADGNQVTQSDARSTVGTSAGNLSISAGKEMHIAGSDLIAGGAAADTGGHTGNIALQAQNISIDTGVDSAHDAATHDARQSGVGVALVGTPLDTLRNLQATGKNGGSKAQKTKAGMEEIGNSAGTPAQVAVTLGNNRDHRQSSSDSATNSSSSLQAAGNIQLVASGDGSKDTNGKANNGNIAITGSNIAAGGNILLDAQRDITVQAATDRYTENNSASSNSNSLSFASNSPGDAARSMSGGPNNSGVSQSPYNAGKSADNSNTQGSGQRASSISGDSVILNAHSGDIVIAGSGIAATNNVNLIAQQGQITVEAGQNTQIHHENHSSKTIGDLGSSNGGTANTVGVRNSSDTLDGAQQLQNPVRSQIVSNRGDVTLDAQKDINVKGSDLSAGNNLTLIGQNLHLDPGVDANQSKEAHQVSQYGVTLALSGAAVTAKQAFDQALDAQAKSNDPRLAALYGAKAGLTVYNYASVLQDQKATTKPVLVKATASIGGGGSHSEASSISAINQGSTLTAGNKVTLVATGSGDKDANGKAADGNITSHGTQISGRDVSIIAVRDINLLSAQDSTSNRNKNDSSNASIGIGFALGGDQNGFTLELAASGSKGRANTDTTVNQQTNVTASNHLTIQSGRDTNLIGAQAKGNAVNVNVGRDLNIVSTQDTAVTDNQQVSGGGGVSICIPPFCYGSAVSGNASASAADTQSHYQSVTRQSGIVAGDGGYDINVKGNTDLVGGLIASSAERNKNNLVTGTLSTRDLHNKADYSSGNLGIAGGYNSGNSAPKPGSGKNDPATSILPVIGIASSGSSAGTTHSAISDGNIRITDEPGQQAKTGKTAAETIAAINHDTGQANGAIATIFDPQKVRKQQELAGLIGDVGNQAIGILGQQFKWADGSPEKIALHGVIGYLQGQAGGGNGLLSGAAAGANDAIGTLVADYLQQNTNLTPAQRNAIQQWSATVTGALLGTALAGNAAGGQSGAAAALDAERHNRQLHPIETELIKNNAARFAKEIYGTDHPTPEQIQGALSMLANTAQSELDYNFGYDVPSSKQAKEFLQTLQREYIAAGNGTLIISGSGGQQLFFTTNAEKNSPYINSGTVDKEIAGVIIKAPIKRPEIPGVNNGKRDPATNFPLDEQGRYSQQYVVDGKPHAAKYFPCPLASAGCGGQNMDMSDPGTAAYVKALDKKVFDDIGTGATLVTIANPVGATGTAAGITGTVANAISGFLFDPTTAIGKEAAQRGFGEYLKKVLKVSAPTADRVVAIIDLAGGWDAFVNRTKTEFTQDNNDNARGKR